MNIGSILLLGDGIETDVLKSRQGSQMAGQPQHLFGSDWQIWLQSGLSQLAATKELLLQSVCRQPISAAQNVEFHPWSINTLKARGSSATVSFLLRVYCTVAVTLQNHPSVCVSLNLSLFCSTQPSPPLQKINSYSVQQLQGDSNLSDYQTNAHPRDHRTAKNKQHNHTRAEQSCVSSVLRFKDLRY